MDPRDSKRIVYVSKSSFLCFSRFCHHVSKIAYVAEAETQSHAHALSKHREVTCFAHQFCLFVFSVHFMDVIIYQTDWNCTIRPPHPTHHTNPQAGGGDTITRGGGGVPRALAHICNWLFVSESGLFKVLAHLERNLILIWEFRSINNIVC